MADPFIGEIRVFSFNFAPVGWAMCQGQILLIKQNQALYGILGNKFGGNGTTTFALPNLQGLTPIHPDELNFKLIGQIGGGEFHTPTVSEMPSHKHELMSGSDATTNVILGKFWGTPAESLQAKPYSDQSNIKMRADALAISGGGQGHENRQPYAVVNYCIALQGIYPPRN
mgnify:CR=1 FL=1